MRLLDCGHREGRGHDCAYVCRRNMLIPRAAEHANTAVGEDPGLAKNATPEEREAYREWSERWDRAYLLRMDALWRESNANARA